MSLTEAMDFVREFMAPNVPPEAMLRERIETLPTWSRAALREMAEGIEYDLAIRDMVYWAQVGRNAAAGAERSADTRRRKAQDDPADKELVIRLASEALAEEGPLAQDDLAGEMAMNPEYQSKAIKKLKASALKKRIATWMPEIRQRAGLDPSPAASSTRPPRTRSRR